MQLRELMTEKLLVEKLRNELIMKELSRTIGREKYRCAKYMTLGT